MGPLKLGSPVLFLWLLATSATAWAQAYDSGDVFCAGTRTSLMVTAVEKLAHSSAAADVESAHAFRCVKFVAGERE